MELWPEGVFYKGMRPNSNPRRLHVNVLGRVLKKSRKPEDRLIIMPYQYYHVHTDCPILSMNSWTIKHVFIVLFRPNHVYLPSTYWPPNHWPLTAHIPPTYQPLTDHIPTTFLRCSLFTITLIYTCIYLFIYLSIHPFVCLFVCLCAWLFMIWFFSLSSLLYLSCTVSSIFLYTNLQLACTSFFQLVREEKMPLFKQGIILSVKL